MSKKIEVVDDRVDAICHALDKIEAINDSLRSAAINVSSAYHAAQDDDRSELAKTMFSLGETTGAFFCLKVSLENLKSLFVDTAKMA